MTTRVAALPLLLMPRRAQLRSNRFFVRLQPQTTFLSLDIHVATYQGTHMHIKSRVLAPCCALAALAVVISAQAGPPIKAGLWEETSTVKRGDTPQRSVTIQNCLTDKDLDSNKIDQLIARMKNNKNCRLENFKHSDRATSSEWVCTGPQVSMRGRGELVYDDSSHFHMSSEEHTTMKDRSVDTILSAQSRWLSSDCGSVKSLAAPGGTPLPRLPPTP